MKRYLMLNAVRGRSGRLLQVGAIAIYGLVALTLLGALIGSPDKKKLGDAATTTGVKLPAPVVKAPPPPVAAPTPAKPKGDPAVDKNTRAYLNAMSLCEVEVGLVTLDIQRGKSTDVELADAATSARDACDSTRSRLASMDTNHFDDQAANGFFAIDRLKSGLNALLAYIDNPRPSKLIEVRNKLQEGDQAARQTRHDINVRRHVYGLRALRS